jgi:hypothetical protein
MKLLRRSSVLTAIRTTMSITTRYASHECQKRSRKCAVVVNGLFEPVRTFSAVLRTGLVARDRDACLELGTGVL